MTPEGGEPLAALPEIHRADPALRRLMPVMVVLIVAAVGALAWWFYYDFLENLPMESADQVRDSAKRPLTALTEVFDGTALLLLLYGIYLLQRGREVRSAPRYPTAQMRLFHDMRILEGTAKRRYATRLLCQGGVCLVLALCLFGSIQYWRHQQELAHPLLNFAAPAR